MGGRGGRRARGGTGQRLMSGILSTRLFELPTPLLVLPGVSSAQVSWRPNIFGGQDCIGPEGCSSSTPKGTIESRPNIFGGKDYRLANSGRIESRPNIFGGQDFRQRIPRRGVPTEHFTFAVDPQVVAPVRGAVPTAEATERHQVELVLREPLLLEPGAPADRLGDGGDPDHLALHRVTSLAMGAAGPRIVGIEDERHHRKTSSALKL